MKPRGNSFVNVLGIQPTTSGKLFLDFFQTDKITGEPKGIIALDIGGYDD
jgi:hypothetical protein